MSYNNQVNTELPESNKASTQRSGKKNRKRKVNASFRHSYGRDPRWWKALAAVVVTIAVIVVMVTTGPGIFGLRGGAQYHYQLGLEYFEDKNYKSAVIELMNALDQDPGYNKARKLLGETYLALNESAQARQELELAKELGISQDPQDASVRFEDALVRFNKRDFRGAIIQLRKVLEQNVDDPVAHSLLGRAYLEIDNGKAAEPHLRRAKQGGTDPTLIAVPLARSYLLQKKFKLLFSFIQSGQYSAELNSKLLVIGGRARISMGELVQANQDFVRAAKLDPKAIEPLIGQARIRLVEGRFDEAQELANQTRLLNSEHSDVWHLQAEILRYQRNLAQALEYYDKALVLDPARAASRKGRAAALLDLNRDEEALAELKAMHLTSSTDPQAAYMYVLALTRNGEVDKAQAVMDHVALVIDKLESSFVQNDPPTLLISGLVNYAKKNHEQAFEHLSRFIELRPDHLESRQILASLLLRRGDAEGALNIFKPVMKTALANPQALMVLGSVFNRLGRYNEAMQMFERAVEMVPDKASLQNCLALSRLASGDRKQAMGDLQSRFDNDSEAGEVGVLLGLVHLRQREFDKALTVIRELIRRQPDNAMTHNLAGTAYIGLGDARAARASFVKAISVSPTFTPGRFNLAKLNLQQGNLDAARFGFLNILEFNPQQVGALIELATIDTRLKHFDLALDWLLKARKVDPGNLVIGLRLVDFYLAVEKLKKALAQAQELKTRYPKNLPVLASLSRVHVALGNHDMANNILQSMANYAAGSPRKMQAVAVQQMQSGDIAGAQSTLRRLLAKEPDYLPAHSMLIEAAVRDKQFDQALNLLEHLQQLKPGAVVADVLKGKILTEMKRYSEAAIAFRRALDKKPDMGVLLQYYYAQRNAGSPESALSALQKWQDKNPSDILIGRVLATAYLDVGQLKESIKLHESLLERIGDDAMILNNLASLYQNVADPRALEFAQRAHALAPDQPATLDTLGWILVRNGESIRGLKYLRLAQNRLAMDLRIGYHIAVALESLGRADEARNQLEEILKPGAKFEGIDEAREMLLRLSGQSS